jgi:hypothetical protein
MERTCIGRHAPTLRSTGLDPPPPHYIVNSWILYPCIPPFLPMVPTKSFVSGCATIHPWFRVLLSLVCLILKQWVQISGESVQHGQTFLRNTSPICWSSTCYNR